MANEAAYSCAALIFIILVVLFAVSMRTNARTRRFCQCKGNDQCGKKQYCRMHSAFSAGVCEGPLTCKRPSAAGRRDVPNCAGTVCDWDKFGPGCTTCHKTGGNPDCWAPE